MEFHKNLQALRKRRGLTQEELAQVLYVSRAAVSKWESGRGYPNIDSLKAIAAFFGVTIDGLLSGEEVLTIAEEDHRQTQAHFRRLVFGVLDLGSCLLFFLPFFGQRADGVVQAVSLFSLSQISPYVKAAYCILVAGMSLWGLLTLVLGPRLPAWGRSVSLLLNILAVLLFMVSSQPYGAAFVFLFLLLKGALLVKTPTVSPL